jgi:hypothetical protein
LREPLRAAGWTLAAVSRQPRAASDGVQWHRGGLPDAPLLAEPFDAVLSLGPLDVFAGAVARFGIAAPRVVAIGSTGVHSKADSPDPAERELAARLAAAEQSLAAAVAGARRRPAA